MKKKVVALTDILIDIIFFISLTLLGKYKLEQNSSLLGSYQIVAALFWATGVLKFKDNNAKIKDFLLDTLKDLVKSILTISFWFWISGEKQVDIYEPITIIIHFIVLIIILKWFVQGSVKLCGSIAYCTQAAIPLIAVLLIHIGIPVFFSMVVAVFIQLFVDNMYCKKKKA